MTDETGTETPPEAIPAPVEAPLPAATEASPPAFAPTNGTAPPESSGLDEAASKVAQAGAERPELIVAAAFAGGFIIALILKRLVR